ncbi:MAG: hypothetical protein ABFD51_10095, partial [Anaerolineaceae bacterium]
PPLIPPFFAKMGGCPQDRGAWKTRINISPHYNLTKVEKGSEGRNNNHKSNNRMGFEKPLLFVVFCA